MKRPTRPPRVNFQYPEIGTRNKNYSPTLNLVEYDEQGEEF
jgi:hypothetical protein